MEYLGLGNLNFLKENPSSKQVVLNLDERPHRPRRNKLSQGRGEGKGRAGSAEPICLRLGSGGRKKKTFHRTSAVFKAFGAFPFPCSSQPVDLGPTFPSFPAVNYWFILRTQNSVFCRILSALGFPSFLNEMQRMGSRRGKGGDVLSSLTAS